MQGLGGMKPGLSAGASMSGNKPASGSGYVTALSPGQTSWSAPNPGWYKFTGIGGGGGSHNASALGGGGGGAVQKSFLLARGTVITFTIGHGNGPNGSGESTTVTFPDGSTMTAGGGVAGNSTGAGGTATGGDLNVTGNPRSGANGGDGPTIGDFVGAAFAVPANSAQTPGTGAGGSNTPTAYSGGNGALYISAI